MSTTRLCLRLLAYARHRKAALGAVALTLLLQIGFTVLQPWPMKVLVDHVLGDVPLRGTLRDAFEALPGGAGDVALLWWTVGATVLIFLLSWALGLLAGYAGIRFGQRLVYDVAGDLFAHLQRLSLRWHTRAGVGNSMRRITSDADCVSVIVQDALLPVVTSVLSLVTIFAIMWQLDSELTLLSLAVVPLMLLALRRYSKPMLERSYEQQEAEGTMYDTLERTLSGLPVVQAFAAEGTMDRRFRADTALVLRRTIAATWAQFKFKILVGLSTALGTAGILYLGARHALEGQLTTGTILVFIAYLGSLYAPLEALMHTSGTIHTAAGSARRVVEVLDAEPEVRDAPGARPAVAVRGAVRIEGAVFGYEPDRPVLRGVDLEASPGEIVAIVGATGAGKSTLVGLIPRFFDPDAGRVLLDGADVRELTVESVRRSVSLVLQESFLFPISIADNIAFGRPHATRAEVEAAARAARAHDFIERLPDGYETIVGERGATLSGGERQRVAIARALLKDAPVLVLDEPTSALDAQTEAGLVGALETLMEGRTTFVIAHRLSTIRRADRIVVLDGGRVAESGTHAELLARGGLYANLHALQTGTAVAAPQIAAPRPVPARRAGRRRPLLDRLMAAFR